MPCLLISPPCVGDLLTGRRNVGLLSGLTLQSSMLPREESSCSVTSSKCDSFSVESPSEPLSDRYEELDDLELFEYVNSGGLDGAVSTVCSSIMTAIFFSKSKDCAVDDLYLPMFLEALAISGRLAQNACFRLLLPLGFRCCSSINERR